MHQAFFLSMVYASVLVNIYEGHRTPNVNSLHFSRDKFKLESKKCITYFREERLKTLGLSCCSHKLYEVYEGIPHLPREEYPHLPHLARERMAL